MYVTRAISKYKNDPGSLSEAPLGPNSGFLVLWDLPPAYTCFGLCDDQRIRNLPFPQDKNLTVIYSPNPGQESPASRDKVLFIPVLNHPLSSNRYYAIRREGKHQGQAITSSKEEDKTTCLCCTFVNDVKPKPLAPSDDYQQVEIIEKRYGFQATCVGTDGIPPGFLRRKGWRVEVSTPRNYHLYEALGSNDSLRFSFPLKNDSSQAVVVGKWYCPFMFLKEGMGLKEQMKMSMFYEVTLEQRWEKIFSKENGKSGENTVLVDIVIQKQAVKVAGRDAVWDESGVVDRFFWFRSFDGDDGGREVSVGLSLEVVERMKWEEERVGCKAGNEREERVTRVQEFGGTDKWENFGCYVLVETFIFRRMDGNLVLSYDFRHTHQIMCKWE